MAAGIQENQSSPTLGTWLSRCSKSYCEIL